mmetsp:Transcript_54596/g.119079  ORF Transcript_54596/g.119079 Transcript_54596/m.119079 type:complete len:212 (-) Transcript_54596:2031-2666(-)
MPFSASPRKTFSTGSDEVEPPAFMSTSRQPSSVSLFRYEISSPDGVNTWRSRSSRVFHMSETVTSPTRAPSRCSRAVISSATWQCTVCRCRCISFSVVSGRDTSLDASNSSVSSSPRWRAIRFCNSLVAAGSGAQPASPSPSPAAPSRSLASRPLVIWKHDLVKTRSSADMTLARVETSTCSALREPSGLGSSSRGAAARTGASHAPLALS